jgi:hypothetical protein
MAVLSLATLVKPNKQWPRLNECIRLFWSFTSVKKFEPNLTGFSPDARKASEKQEKEKFIKCAKREYRNYHGIKYIN